MVPERSCGNVHCLSRRSLLVWVAGAIGGAWALRGALAWDASQLQRKMASSYGQPGLQRLQAWMQLLQSQQGQNPPQQLVAINDFWNLKVVAGVDQNIWHEADYCATPLETLGKGSGDCEDFVIGKYFSLIRLGVPARQMRLIYVRARVGGVGSTQSIAHMVLGFYATPQADPLVLDNLVAGIQKASQRTDLTPVFSFDAEAVYVNGARSTSSERINRWQNLLVRMRQEGFDI